MPTSGTNSELLNTTTTGSRSTLANQQNAVLGVAMPSLFRGDVPLQAGCSFRRRGEGAVGSW
jgi:hypothetical protein